MKVNALDEDVREFDSYQYQARQFERTPHCNVDAAINRAVLGLIGEVGEIAEHVKKSKYEGKELFDVNLVVDELGDVLWYAAALADAIHVTLSEVANRNLHKLYGRYRCDCV